MSVYLGIDGGGSSCRVLAVDDAGIPIYHGCGGAANVATVAPARLKATLAKATIGCPKPDIVCGCFAGLLTPFDRERAEEAIRSIFPDARIIAYPDYAAALKAGGLETDVCVVAGTGSLVCSLKDGKLVKSGGRGFLFGDFGSGFRFGFATTKRLIDHPEQCSDAAKKSAMEVFGSLEEPAIMSKVYGTGTPAAVLGKMLPAFLRDYKSGASYALDAVIEQFDLLAGQVADHIKMHFPSKTVNIGLAGGVWKSSTEMVEAFRDRLDLKTNPVEHHVFRIMEPPVRGAALLAMESQL